MKKKLQENKGITIVLAMGIFLVAAILSAVIVSVSLNNAQRVQRQRDEQQANFAISSAVGFFIELFDGAHAEYIASGSSGEWKFYYGDCLLKDYSDLQTKFEAAFKGAIDSSAQSFTCTIASSDSETNEAISADAIVTIRSNGDMKIKIVKTSTKSYLDRKFYQILNIKASTFTDGTDYKECTWNYLSIDRKGGTTE